MTKVGLYAIGKSTTLESNKSLFRISRRSTGLRRPDMVLLSMLQAFFLDSNQ
jgi:hypothetical protein